MGPSSSACRELFIPREAARTKPGAPAQVRPPPEDPALRDSMVTPTATDSEHTHVDIQMEADPEPVHGGVQDDTRDAPRTPTRRVPCKWMTPRRKGKQGP